MNCVLDLLRQVSCIHLYFFLDVVNELPLKFQMFFIPVIFGLNSSILYNIVMRF